MTGRDPARSADSTPFQNGTAFEVPDGRVASNHRDA
jgi:hypothetical protein